MLPNLNALRIFLALAVVLFHIPTISSTVGFAYFNASPIFHKGELAVLYFFTLSGFLIIRNIYIELQQTGSIQLKRFYSRRAGRILPPYLLVLFIGLCLYHFVLPRMGIPFQLDYSLAEALFYNIFFLSNVFKTLYPNIGGILSVLWSIGVEEQFYLICPLLLLFFRKQVAHFLWGSIFVLFALLLFVPSFYQYNNFFFYFAFGGLLSILALQFRLKWFLQPWIQWIFLLLFFTSFFTNFFNGLPPFLYHVVNMLLSGLFIVSIAHQPRFVIQHPWIDSLGKISYGIYLYHMVVITGVLFLLQKWVDHGLVLNSLSQILLINAATISFTCLVAWLSHKYFESLFYRKP